MKFKYRWLVIRSVALIMVIYISVLALSMPIGAVVDTSRGEGDDFDLTSASTFPMTVGFAFRSSSDSDYNYITATDIGGYGQEFNRTLTGTDKFTYTFDELNENATTTRNLHYTFGNVYWSDQSLFGYRYGYQPIVLSCDTLGSNEACETIVLRAPDVVFNTYVFDYYRDAGINALADLAYLGIPVISAPQVIGPSESRYVGTCSIIYSVTDQHGNTKKFNYAASYSSENNDYIPLLNINDLYTYYGSPDSANNSSKILISDWYVYWDVDYYEYVDNTQPSYIDIQAYALNGNLVVNDGLTITDDIGLTFSQWASHFSHSDYSVQVTGNGVELTYTSGNDTYIGYIYDGINRVTGFTVISQGITYNATLNYVVPSTTEDELSGTWIIKQNPSKYTGYSDKLFTVDGVANRLSKRDPFEISTALISTFRLYGSSTSDSNSCLNISFSSPQNTSNTYYYTDGSVTCFQDPYSFPQAFYCLPDNPYFEQVRTVTIYSKLNEVADGDVLLSWLKANAIKQPSTSFASVMSLSDEPVSAVAAASGEWVKVDSDKRNIVQIGYPLYDTSSGDPDYAELLGFPDFDNFLKGSTIDIPTVPGYPGDSDKEVSSLTRWLGVAVSGFTDVELWDGFSIGGVLAIIVSFSVVMMFLKVFAGG